MKRLNSRICARPGYNNLPVDVQQVRYSSNYVYVSSSGIPAYTIGPLPGNPNVPSNQSYVLMLRTDNSKTCLVANGAVHMTLLWSFSFFRVLGFYKHNAPDGASERPR